jgi:hypothetical protein
MTTNPSSLKFDRELSELAAKNLGRYATLAARCARNESLPAGEIVAACGAAGKSTDEFKTLVARITAREDAARDIAKASVLKAEGDKIAKTAGPLNAEIEALRKKHKDELAVLIKKCGHALAESAQKRRTAQELRTKAEALLLATAAEDGDQLDAANVAIDEPQPTRDDPAAFGVPLARIDYPTAASATR